ncbi:MAG: NRAMP family metal ion transporter [Anaerolinea sp.]|nr:NRAMP family metal ion transporter [Anaerolinea sp.]
MTANDLRIDAPALASARPASRVRRILRVIGPAWIVMVADVDAASVLTAAKAGTDFGYAMLLPIFALVPILYLVQEMTARLAIGTGIGHAELIRERFGVRWGAVSVVSMVVIDLLAYVAEFAGIVLGASLIGIPAVPAVLAALAFHTFVVLTGTYARFEIVTLVLSLALFAFVGLAVAAGPDPRAVLGGLSPLQPFDKPGYLDLVVATVGAVIMPWMLFYQQAATVEKGLGPGDLRAARWETFIGAVGSEILMAAVVIAAAAAVGTNVAGGVAGANVAGEAVAGGLALPAGLAALADGVPGLLIAIGMIGAGLLAAVVISLSSAWAWSELLRWPHSLNLSLRRAPGFYALYLLEVVPAAIVALVAQDLVAVVIDAMILNVLVLVIPLTFLVRLSGDRALLGPLAASRRYSAMLWLMTAGLLALGLTSVVGVIGRAI